MLKSALLVISMLMTLGIYVPLFKRIFERKHTRDFSKMSAWFVMLCQVNGFLLATAEHAHFLMIWYVIQTALTLLQLWVICHYYNTLPPLVRENNELADRIRKQGSPREG